MDMNGSEGIFRVSVEVYPYSCSKLEHLHEGDMFSILCRNPTSKLSACLQQAGFKD
jgi:hypothetical protein